MESFSRELTAAEREEMQRRQDLALTMEMFGEQPTTGDQRPYSDILSKDEFEDWGLKWMLIAAVWSIFSWFFSLFALV
ncbi:unnamed protein product [Cylicostephanus goldi]|uniref:Uncharacterized protein n=1 Tax=Cylicostephanus goldi TaxID=71465 RepID=A0A3P7N0Y1_CYLGO|nr:unnamed protein product [Cylicostephanus goldi]